VMPEPRIGFAWDPTGDHKGVLRGGFGMSHDREEGNLVFNPAFNNPLLETTPSISSPTYLNFSQISNAPQSSPGTLSSITGVERSGQVPTVYSYSLGVQREAGRGVTYDIAYVGTQSRHLITNYDINTQSSAEPSELPWRRCTERGTEPPTRICCGWLQLQRPVCLCV
jgi:hypothetical protein